MTHTDEELISELHRFYEENGRVPTYSDMHNKFGYPYAVNYVNHFKTWNNALEIAKLELNEIHPKLDGTETCSYCGCYKKQGQSWINKGLPKGEVMCQSCYEKTNTNYMNGNLDKNSNTAKATISEQVVKNVLNLEEKHDCNFACGFGYPIDLYHKEKYKCINVKDSKLYKNKNLWQFDLSQEVLPDTYIMLGYDENRKNILKVWITDAIDDLVFNEKTETLKKSLSITNDFFSGLKRAKPWEVDAKPYNDMLHKMSEKRKETNGEECFLNNDDLNGGN